MAFLALLLFILAALLPWYVFWWLIPSTLRDSTMYRLWHLRDDLTDEIINGAYPTEREAALALREAMIGLAKRLEDVSVVKTLLMRSLTRDLPFDPLLPAMEAGPERERLEAKLAEVVALVDGLARRKTPSGWLTTILPLSYLKVKERDLAALLKIARPAGEY